MQVLYVGAVIPPEATPEALALHKAFPAGSFAWRGQGGQGAWEPLPEGSTSAPATPLGRGWATSEEVVSDAHRALSHLCGAFWCGLASICDAAKTRDVRLDTMTVLLAAAEDGSAAFIAVVASPADEG